LYQEVVSLHAKWQLYLDLFSRPEDTALLSELVRGSFQLIEEALRNDMTMAICRLSDPDQSCGNDNLSIEKLGKQFGTIAGLDLLVQRFLDECKPVREYRNKRVGHNDFRSVLNPIVHPLPGITRSTIVTILQLACQVLNKVYRSFVDGELGCQPHLLGDGRELVNLLRTAKHGQADRSWQSIRQPTNAIKCQISKGGFPSERVFRVNLVGGVEHVGVAPVHYFFTESGQPLPQQPGENGLPTPGFIAGRILAQKDNALLVSVPSGEVLLLPASEVSGNPSRSCANVPVQS
jgi:hypothetical protein